jgi:lipoprotein-anchoring transpeptidase ErfK/SrfK
VEVDRAARRLVVRHGGRVVRSVSIVVGAGGSPTPAGSFAISEELRGDPGSFTGSWVLPLTAYSGTYRQFDGGPGRVAIHGRGGASLRDPLGSAASHGCIRVSNRLISWMASHLQPGVPVRIR